MMQKALNLFNAALVTPTYYVFFTSSTIVTSAILFQGFKGTVTSIITVILGFLQICAGVVLLQLSKSAKDVPDAAVFKGDLDQVRTVAEQEEPESEPKADAIRGAAAIIRRMSQTRQRTEVQEAKRVHELRMKDQMEPIGENEQVEWDGLRRRKTVIDPTAKDLQRRKTLHPPLGMAHFPEEDGEDRPSTSDVFGSGGMHRGFFHSFRRHASSKFSARQNKSLSTGTPALSEPISPGRDDTPPTAQVLGAMEMDHVYGLPPSLRGGDNTADNAHFDPSTEYTGAHGKPIMWADSVETRPSESRSSTLAPPPPPHGGGAKRQFSFTNPFTRHKHDAPSPDPTDPHRPSSSSKFGIGSRSSSKEHSIPGLKSATEEERLGLVKGDSHTHDLQRSLPEYDEDDWQQVSDGSGRRAGNTNFPLIREDKESESSGRSSPDLNAPGIRQATDRDDDGWHARYETRGPGGSQGNRGGPAFI